MLGNLTITDAKHKVGKLVFWNEHTVRGIDEVNTRQRNVLQNLLDLHHPKSTTYVSQFFNKTP